MKNRIERALAKAEERLAEMRAPLKQIDIDEIFEEIDTEDELEISEDANRYWGTRNVDYDLDPNEL